MTPARSCRLVMLAAISILASGCGEDPTSGPEPGSLSLSPTTQWSGGVVDATSEVFAHAEDWRVQVDGQVVDSWRVATDVVAFALPDPMLTGTASVTIEIQGAALPTATVDVVGNAWPVRRVGCGGAEPCSLPTLPSDPQYYHGAALPTGQLLAFFDAGAAPGFGRIDLGDPAASLDWIPGLSTEQPPGLVAPGASARAGGWIFDRSPADAAVQPAVWQLDPSVAEIGPLGCVPEGVSGGYAIVELASHDCLVLTDPGYGSAGSLTLNGSSAIAGYEQIPWGWTAGCAGFRTSPGNDWTTLRTMQGDWFCELATPGGLPAWPVFDAAGNRSFSTPRYPEWVRGADFTPHGDTLWVVAEASTWTLDAWNPSTGELLAEMPLDGFDRCEDVLVDPARARIYASCFKPDIDPSRPAWPSLVVVDRSALHVEAVLDTYLADGWPFDARPPFVLVYGGSSGQVHLTSVWDGTTAPTERGVMVATYDVF